MNISRQLLYILSALLLISCFWAITVYSDLVFSVQEKRYVRGEMLDIGVDTLYNSKIQSKREFEDSMIVVYSHYTFSREVIYAANSFKKNDLLFTTSFLSPFIILCVISIFCLSENFTTEIISLFSAFFSLKIYISYSSLQSSTLAAEQIQQVISKSFRNLEVIMEKDVLKYGDRVDFFMRKLAQADFVVLVLSDKYFKSEACMEELTLIRKYGNFQDRTLPV